MPAGIDATCIGEVLDLVRESRRSTGRRLLNGRDLKWMSWPGSFPEARARANRDCQLGILSECNPPP